MANRSVSFEEIRNFGDIEKNATQKLGFRLMKVNDVVYLDVRIWSVNEIGEMKATGKGITIPMRVLDQFKKKFDEIYAEIVRDFKELLPKIDQSIDFDPDKFIS
ncbi:MAG: PC4/YdbC family ssDNA-binding protein [Candidatus Helarchaeota archaeon]